MREANSNATTNRHAQQFGSDFWSAVDQLKRIADQSADAALTEGPVNPDRQLLDLCATALHHLSHAQKARDARRGLHWVTKEGAERSAAMAEDDRLFEAYCAGEREGKLPLFQVSKIKATTPAGIYAKAMIVRASKTGAASLAMSLASDLLDCPGLRATLWPAEGA